MNKPASSWHRGLAATSAVAIAGATLLLILTAARPAPASARTAGRFASARAARTLNATDTAHLHYIHSSGSQLYEEGAASGTLPGSMRAHCNVGPVLTASFTIYTHGGTITGSGSATPHGSGVYESFSGSVLVTGGTGLYAHAHGRAGLYGTFDRKTYALVLQTTGRLSY
jgi:hypothetical protein